jgi:hypothetical protein
MSPDSGERQQRLEAKPLLCHDCLVLCVRCAVEHHIDDDMDQHDLIQDLYEALRLRGHPEAY